MKNNIDKKALLLGVLGIVFSLASDAVKNAKQKDLIDEAVRKRITDLQGGITNK